MTSRNEVKPVKPVFAFWRISRHLSEDWVWLLHVKQNLISKLPLFVHVLLPLFPPPLDYLLNSYPIRVDYDFGLRVLKSVLVSASNIYRERIQQLKQELLAQGQSLRRNWSIQAAAWTRGEGGGRRERERERGWRGFLHWHNEHVHVHCIYIFFSLSPSLSIIRYLFKVFVRR